MTIIDSQFYIIDSLSLDVSLEWNTNLVVAWLNYFQAKSFFTRFLFTRLFRSMTAPNNSFCHAFQ